MSPARHRVRRVAAAVAALATAGLTSAAAGCGGAISSTDSGEGTARGGASGTDATSPVAPSPGPPPSSTAAPPPTSSVDAAPPPAAPIACGTAPCDGDTQLCCYVGVSSSCRGRGGACGGYGLLCSGVANCGSNEVCCFDSTAESAECAPRDGCVGTFQPNVLPSYLVVCADDQECDPASRCSEGFRGLPFKVCRPRTGPGSGGGFDAGPD